MGKTDDAIREIQERNYSFKQFINYLHTLPKGISARVVGRMLDNAKSSYCAERFQASIDRYFNRLKKLEELEDDPFSPPAIGLRVEF